MSKKICQRKDNVMSKDSIDEMEQIQKGLEEFLKKEVEGYRESAFRQSQDYDTEPEEMNFRESGEEEYTAVREERNAQSRGTQNRSAQSRTSQTGASVAKSGHSKTARTQSAQSRNTQNRTAQTTRSSNTQSRTARNAQAKNRRKKKRIK